MSPGNYFVYIITNPGKTVLYTGITNDLYTRMLQHYENRGKKETFAGRYYCYKLIYYERYLNVDMAIEREKEIKDLSREKKEELIRAVNSKWRTLVVKDKFIILKPCFIQRFLCCHSGGNFLA